MAKIARTTIAGLLLATAAVGWVLVRRSGSSPQQLAHVADRGPAECRDRCLAKARAASGVSAQAGQTYCEDFCACMKQSKLAMKDRLELSPPPGDVEKSCEPRALAKARLAWPPVPITDPRHPDYWRPGWE